MTGVLVAVGVFGGIAVASLGFGLATLRALRVGGLDGPLETALAIVLGLVEVAVLALAAGHLHLLRPGLDAAIGVGGTAVLVVVRERVASILRRARAALLGLTPANAVLVALPAAAVAAVAAAGLRKPWATDEIEYHWPAPLFWAHAHHWAAAPYKFVNGPALMEWLYTLPATTGSYQAAHWMHGLMFVVLVLAAVSIATSIGASRSLAAAGAVSVTVAVDQSAWAYNDVAAASFGLVAVAVLFSPGAVRFRFLLAAVALAAAAEVKVLLLGAVPALMICALGGPARASGRALVRAGLLLVGIPVVVLGATAVRTHALIGRFTNVPAGAIAHYGSPGWRLGTGFYPDVRHTALLPLEPFFTGVIGNHEPWGNRTGVFLLVLLPVACALFALGRRPRSSGLLLLCAAVSFVGIGLVFPRTRFLVFSYELLVLFVVAVVATLRGRARAAAIATAAAATALSLADSVHVLFHGMY